MIETPAARLRRLLAAPGIIPAPAVFDPFAARIAEAAGFPCIALGGFALGAGSTVTEPLLSLGELADAARRITAAVGIPLVVDAGAGFGEPLHVMRTVQELERAGVAALHIEDQIFPKRAHYHRDYREHTIPAEEMAAKVRYAARARRDPDLVIVARTDAMKTEGYAEGIRRARMFAEAGADMVMLFPNDADEAARAPKDAGVPLVYVNSTGNRVGRPVYALQELEALGYRMAYDAIGVTITVYRAVEAMLRRLRETGRSGIEANEGIAARQAIERLIGLEDHYKVEEETVER